MKRFLVLLSLLGSFFAARAREVHDINRDWKFFTFNERDSSMVNLPHMWNQDALSGQKNYYRGIGNYLRYVDISSQWRGKRVFVKFYGANSVTHLMVNGRYVGEHRGGNNAFAFEVTRFLRYGRRNLFWVVVNNGRRIDVLPTTDFTNSYGGLFRRVEIIVTDDVALGFDDYGSDGVAIRCSDVSSDRVEGDAIVRLSSLREKQVTVDVDIFDNEGNAVGSFSSRVRTEEGKEVTATIPFEVDAPVLWQGTDQPYLYRFRVRVSDGTVSDEVTVRTGFRTVSVDAADGFLLNGRPYPLRGVVLYRDRPGVGTAVSEHQVAEDLDLICNMGANAIRVAEGTHCQEFYDLCDERGILVMTDAPFVGAVFLDSKGFYNFEDFKQNGKMQLQELIWQNYNHPSLFAWGVFVEPELRGDDPIPFIREMNAIAKALDPSRFTVGCSNKDGEVNTITDLIVWNHTFGWKEGMPEDIAIWQEQIHSDPVWNKLHSAVSYKCGGSIAHQTGRLEKSRMMGNWHPENWQTHFHEVYLRTLRDDRRFWAVWVGNMFDFGTARFSFGEGNGVNDYGLMTFDRCTPKDAYYLYKANWNESDPFVHIVGKRYAQRPEERRDIRVYSNLSEVELFVNGVSQGVRKGNYGIFIWNQLLLPAGSNRIEARSGESSDSAIIEISKSYTAPL